MRHDPETGLTSSGIPVDPKYHHPPFTGPIHGTLYVAGVRSSDPEPIIHPITLITIDEADRYARKVIKLRKIRDSVVVQMQKYLMAIDKKIEWLESNIRSFMVSNKQATGASTFSLDGVRLSIRKKSPKWVIRDAEVFHEWCESSIRISDYPELFDHVLRRPRLMKHIGHEGALATFKGEHVPGLDWDIPMEGDVSVSVKEDKDG